MNDKGPYIKPLILENTTNEKGIIQMGLTLDLILGEDGVRNNPVKLAKG